MYFFFKKKALQERQDRVSIIKSVGMEVVIRRDKRETHNRPWLKAGTLGRYPKQGVKVKR
jgi:hypothetical protein